MTKQTKHREGGFTLIEAALVVLVIGAVLGFATPKFVNAMREYRLSMASRQLTDLIHRAKTQAVSDNRGVTLRVDTAGNRLGMVLLDTDGTELRTEYVNLPQGVMFSMPANVIAPMTGAPIARSVSFAPQTGSTTVFEQQFNSRGFPVVGAPTTIQAIYLGNGTIFRAVTLTSVGGIRTWTWMQPEGHPYGGWVNTRASATTSN